MQYLNERKIPFYYLYDTVGSAIFNEITQLDEYYPFKKEEEIIKENIDKILSFKDDLKNEKITLVEFGAGYSLKTDIVLTKLLEKFSIVEFVAIDVSESACIYTQEMYKDRKGLTVKPFVGTYDQYFEAKKSYKNRVIYMWLGSSVGNLTKSERMEFFSKTSQLMTYRDFFLVGFDSNYKDSKIIKLAYDDPKGLTARFILNILTHLKNKYSLLLDEQDFVYAPIWNQDETRVEMYIKTVRDTMIKSRESNEEIIIKKEEKIFVEYSHKFSREQVEKETDSSDLFISDFWFTKDKYFMFCLLLKSLNPLQKFSDILFRDVIGYDNLKMQPIPLRNTFTFYLGHFYAFYDIKVFNLPTDSEYFDLFERGRDPFVDEPEKCHRHSNVVEVSRYPPYKEILEYIERIRKKIKEHIMTRGFTFNMLTGVEHEMMHQETLTYMIRMANFSLQVTNLNPNFVVEKKIIQIPQRTFERGSNETFVWDNESPAHIITVKAFKVDNLPITWAEFMPFLKDNIAILSKVLNLNENFQVRISNSTWVDFEKAKNLPAWVSLEIAMKYVSWVNQQGTKCRLMTEDEYDSMATKLSSLTKGNVGFKNLHATPVGLYEDYSDDGVCELMGNGWELTETYFRPFKGFEPMSIYSEYSCDFFSDQHFVLKGAGPFTNTCLCRKSFRNWFQYNYEYQSSKFRLVYDLE
jgi:dimethylhistidine N-methyltransferase